MVHYLNPMYNIVRVYENYLYGTYVHKVQSPCRMVMRCLLIRVFHHKHRIYIDSGGSKISPRRGRQHTILPKFPKKLHEIERIWAPGPPPSPPLR